MELRKARTMKRFYTSTVLSSLMLGVMSPAFAIEPPVIVEQSQQEFVEPDKSQVGLPDQKSLSTTQQAAAIKVESVQLEGGTVFELEQIVEKVKPIIGKTVNKIDLLKVLRSITAMYQEAGYPLSFAFLPNQNTDDGELTIVLVEGYIAQSDIQIADEDARHRVEKIVAKMQAEKPLKQDTFERYLKLIERTPGYKIKINVPKPKKVNGATTIRVEEVESNSFDVSFGLDDSKEEEVRLLVSATANSMTSYGDKFTVSTLVPNDTIDEYYAINYQQDISTEGLQFDISGNHFKSQSDERIIADGIYIDAVEDKTRDRLGFGLKYPVILSKSESLWFGGKLSHLDESREIDYAITDGVNEASIQYEQDLKYSSLELYSQWQLLGTKQIFYMQTAIRQGVELGDNRNHVTQTTINSLGDSSSVERKGSESTYFTLFDADIVWRYALHPHFRIQSKANIFWSDDILPTAEQVRYGGKRYGRGYPDGQAQGDRGFAAELELRYLQPTNWDIIRRVEPYIAVDTARTELRANDNKQKLSSAAVGLEITDTKHYSIGMEYAKPLGDPHYETDDRSPVYNVRARWNF